MVEEERGTDLRPIRVNFGVVVDYARRRVRTAGRLCRDWLLPPGSRRKAVQHCATTLAVLSILGLSGSALLRDEIGIVLAWVAALAALGVGGFMVAYAVAGAYMEQEQEQRWKARRQQWWDSEEKLKADIQQVRKEADDRERDLVGQIKNIETRIAHIQRCHSVADRLSQLRVAAVKELYAIQEPAPGQETDQWKADEGVWREEVQEVLECECPKHVRDRFATIGPMNKVSFYGGNNPEWHKLQKILGTRLEILADIIADVPKPSAHRT